jgi:hypothetical protein
MKFAFTSMAGNQSRIFNQMLKEDSTSRSCFVSLSFWTNFVFVYLENWVSQNWSKYSHRDCHRSEGNAPSFFVTSHEHIQMLYDFLGDNLNKKQIQDLMDNCLFLLSLQWQVTSLDFLTRYWKKIPLLVLVSCLCLSELILFLCILFFL